MVHKLPHPLTATVGALSFISSLEVMSSRTMLTFSAAPLGKTFLQRGHFGEDDMANAVAKQL